MNYALQNFFAALPDMLVAFYNSPFVLVVKILAGIYLAVLTINIILLLIFRDIPAHLRVGIKGMDLPLVTKSKMQKRWESIKDRLKGENVSQYKVAIIEADTLAEEILGGIGYTGANMGEKLEQVGSAHLDEHLESLKGVHQIRNRIVHETDFEIDRRMAEAVIGVYENFLRYLEYLD
jgi:hypothetical protein